MKKFNGQCSQDEFLELQVFKGLRGGFFVDVGAHNGITINNTYYFEKYNGWSGICIEPIPAIFSELEKNRNCKCLNLAIDNKEGQADFVLNTGYTEMLSGLKSHYDPRHFDRKDREIKSHGGDSHILTISTKKLSTVFDEQNVNHVHYLSIDVEGAEMAVIESIEFDRVFIDIIGFEANYENTSQQIIEYLKENNYVFLSNCGHDIMMVHKDSKFCILS